MRQIDGIENDIQIGGMNGREVDDLDQWGCCISVAELIQLAV